MLDSRYPHFLIARVIMFLPCLFPTPLLYVHVYKFSGHGSLVRISLEKRTFLPFYLL